MKQTWTKDTAPKGKGRRPKRFCFTYQNIAEEAGIKERTVKEHVYMSLLNPYNLGSVYEYIKKQKQKEIR